MNFPFFRYARIFLPAFCCFILLLVTAAAAATAVAIKLSYKWQARPEILFSAVPLLTINMSITNTKSVWLIFFRH